MTAVRAVEQDRVTRVSSCPGKSEGTVFLSILPPSLLPPHPFPPHWVPFVLLHSLDSLMCRDRDSTARRPPSGPLTAPPGGQPSLGATPPSVPCVSLDLLDASGLLARRPAPSGSKRLHVCFQVINRAQRGWAPSQRSRAGPPPPCCFPRLH